MPYYDQYRVRKILVSKTRAVYGITLPQNIGTKYEGVKFNVSLSGTQIIFTSGLDILKLKHQIENKEIEV